uniref:RNA polymerase I-specific transcription initiation factor RRN3 n=1 Tax=Populus davidiana TaxID=266767 RepID=A0A6M2F4S1_9ROSI
MGVELTHKYTEYRAMEDQEEVEEGVSVTDWDLVYHVRDALLYVKTGDRSSYHQLVGVLHHRDRFAPDKVALLLTSLKALSGAVSYINDDDHVSLLQSIFGMSMWNCVPDVMDALLELIICLAASNGKYVDLCLDMLVNNFMPPMESDMLRHPRGQAKKDQVLPRVHTGLEVIVDLVPLAALKLSTTVVQKRPMFFRKDFNMDRLKCRMEIYLKNMLMLEGGAIREFVGNSMLVEVVNMMLELDVAIGWDELLRDDPSKGIFTMELEDEEEEADDDGQANDGELPSTLTLRNLGKNVTADLLDSLMIQFLEHLEACADKKRLSEVFETLLSSFMATILNTYKSKFSQFTIFYACALDPENCGVKFAQTLADLFISTCNPPVTRMSAVAYLSSYLARGKFLSAAFVMNMLKRLVDWCLRYCEEQDSGMNPKAHQVFYSACQGIMYVLCFHMKSIMNVPTLKSQLLLMPIEPILKHKLGPLEVCLPSIVNEFLRQAKAAHLFTISKAFIFEDLLESDLSRDFGGLERLDMFFPFDPCLLKKCDRGFIRPNFIYWNHVKTTYDDDDEDSSDEDIADDFGVLNEENFMEEGMARSYDQDIDLDEFDFVMNKMSITPKNTSGFHFGGERMPSKLRPSTSPESL